MKNKAAMRTYNEIFERYERLVELIGQDEFISNVFDFLGSDDVNEMVDSIARDYNVDLLLPYSEDGEEDE